MNGIRRLVLSQLVDEYIALVLFLGDDTKIARPSVSQSGNKQGTAELLGYLVRMRVVRGGMYDPFGETYDSTIFLAGAMIWSCLNLPECR